MATNLGTFNTRIQLKSDTEANWSAHPIVPLSGEMIIYTADNTHNYTRLKVGDGITSVTNLPFIDAGTINGSQLPHEQVHVYANTQSFPQPGIENMLYIDLSTGFIYCYVPTSGYTQLSNFTYEKTNASNIVQWRAGTPTILSCEEGKLTVDNGRAPSLDYVSISVVKEITKEVTR